MHTYNRVFEMFVEEAPTEKKRKFSMFQAKKGSKSIGAITQQFIVPASIGAGSIFQKYIELAHPEKNPDARFYRNVHPKSGNFYRTNTGKNYWTDCAQAIASWFGFVNPDNYSSHSFRATSVNGRERCNHRTNDVARKLEKSGGYAGLHSTN